MSNLPFWAPLTGTSGPVYSDTGYDLALFGSTQVPGVVEVSVTAERGLDEQKAAGRHGATLIFRGRKPVRAEMRVRLWTPEQWTAMQTLLGEIYPQGGTGTPKAFDVTHPALALLKVGQMAVVSVSAPKPTGTPGEREIVIQLVEYTAPAKRKQNATKKIEGAAVATRPEFSASGMAADGTPVRYTPGNANVTLPSGQTAFVGPRS